MQPMSSMQTALLPGVTPGWNDPPPLGKPGSGSRLNRYRRVVDPSLSAAGGSPTPYAASPQQGMPMGVSQGMPPSQQMPPPQYGQPVQPIEHQPVEYGQTSQFGQQPPQFGQAQVYAQPPQQTQYPQPPQHTLPPQVPQYHQPPQHALPPQAPQYSQLHENSQPQPFGQPIQPLQQVQQPYSQPDYGMSAIPEKSNEEQQAGLQEQQVHPHSHQYQQGDVLSPPAPPSSSVPPTFLDHLMETHGQVVRYDYHHTYDADVKSYKQAVANHEAQIQTIERKQIEKQQKEAIDEMSKGVPAKTSSPEKNYDHGLFDATTLHWHPLNVPVIGEKDFYTKETLKGMNLSVRVQGDMSSPAKTVYWHLVQASTQLIDNRSQGVQLNLKELPREMERELGNNELFVKKMHEIICAILDLKNWVQAEHLVNSLVKDYPMETKFTPVGGQLMEKKWVNGIRLLIRYLDESRVHQE